MTSPARVRTAGVGTLEITIAEGRKRQVRRMCEALGHRVTSLERVAFGPLRLSGLAPGQTRPLTSAEIDRLREATGLKP
jgi:23S rRNA pseudouridine2605 synthase